MNKTILKGRISTDVEIKFTQQTNKKMARFSVAVRRDFKNQQGEYDTDFFNCSAFGNTAEFLEKYFTKGQEILLIGRLQNRSWETESGEKRYATDVIVDNVEFCGNKSNNNLNNNNFENAMQEKGIELQSTDDLPF